VQTDGPGATASERTKQKTPPAYYRYNATASELTKNGAQRKGIVVPLPSNRSHNPILSFLWAPFLVLVLEKLPHYSFSWTVSLQKQRNTSLKEKLEEALFGELSLEEAMDLSRDRLILELEVVLERTKPRWEVR
jgi:hypothetical protein